MYYHLTRVDVCGGGRGVERTGVVERAGSGDRGGGKGAGII